MSDIEKLKEVTLFHNLSEAMLSEFAGYFKRTDYAAGDVVFKEGTQGDSLYIIVDGEVIVEKSMDAEDREFKTLAILSAGDFFGEMAVMQDQVRFAQARASRESSLYEIGREKFFSFIKENPETGISIFSEIMRSLLKRLQHTSSELTMLFDLSGHLLATYKTPADFLSAVMEDLRHYFEGSWNVRAYVYNMFNEEYEQVYLRESFPQDKAACELPASPQSGWLGDNTYLMACSAEGHKLACTVFSRETAVTPLEKNNLATIFNTISAVIGSAMVNLEHQTEAAMLEKLKKAKI
ncbi:MAG: hypothetical protein COT18_05020 [Elusimicrobia bacterium CG08_land_8_20_14_0_20_59_10]|nr:MAG: hypothetical protein COT18_05020 [Elusimicrobia bacterium CG08_land_8_20_14_0_20_59_10]